VVLLKIQSCGNLPGNVKQRLLAQNIIWSLVFQCCMKLSKSSLISSMNAWASFPWGQVTGQIINCNAPAGILYLASFLKIDFSDGGKLYSNPDRLFLDMSTPPLIDWSLVKPEAVEGIMKSIVAFKQVGIVLVNVPYATT